MSITDPDLPALFRAADQSSKNSQDEFLLLIRFDLGLMLVGALSTAWAMPNKFQTELAILGAVALVASFLLTIILLQMKPDKTWFGARAVAESVKTIAWRYMTGAEPYSMELTPLQADDQFGGDLGIVIRENRDLGGALGGVAASGEQLTEAMRNVRSSPLDLRKATYLECRIKDQRSWYTTKAVQNRRNARRWLVAVATVQGLAVVAAVVLIGWPDLPVSLAGVFTTLAAAFLAWLQVKQHQELSHAYALAAQELGIIESKAKHLDTDAAFADFVSDAENAISREHTMWVARRDTP